jgi:hypothetical protein
MLTISEAIQIGVRLKTCIDATRSLLLDEDTREVAATAWSTIRKSIEKDSPKGKRISKDERKAIFAAFRTLLRSLADVSSDEAMDLYREVSELGFKIAEDVLD